MMLVIAHLFDRRINGIAAYCNRSARRGVARIVQGGECCWRKGDSWARRVRTAVARTSAYVMAVGQRHGEAYQMWATPVEAGHLALAGQDELLEGAMGFQLVEYYQVGVSWLLTIAC
jgi:hypothetical protein